MRPHKYLPDFFRMIFFNLKHQKVQRCRVNKYLWKFKAALLWFVSSFSHCSSFIVYWILPLCNIHWEEINLFCLQGMVWGIFESYLIEFIIFKKFFTRIFTHNIIVQKHKYCNDTYSPYVWGILDKTFFLSLFRETFFIQWYPLHSHTHIINGQKRIGDQ